MGLYFRNKCKCIQPCSDHFEDGHNHASRKLGNPGQSDEVRPSDKATEIQDHTRHLCWSFGSSPAASKTYSDPLDDQGWTLRLLSHVLPCEYPAA